MAESEVDVRPSLRNADDVQRALERVYPPSLRDAGVTGETVLQFVINEEAASSPGRWRSVVVDDGSRPRPGASWAPCGSAPRSRAATPCG